MAADHLGTDIGLELVEPSGIQQALKQRADIVTHPMVDRDQVVERFGVTLGGGVRTPRRPCVWQAADVLADAAQTFLVVFGAVMGDRTDRGVRGRAAQRSPVDYLTRRA